MLKERLGSSFDRVVHRLIPILTRIPLSPDQWSLLGVAFSALAAGSLAAGSLALAGSWMFCAGFCDIVDGAVARARHQESRRGAFLDSTLDRVSDLLVFGGLAYWQAASGQLGGLVLVLCALGGSFVTSYARARAEVELGRFPVGWMERSERCLILIAGAWTGWMTLALWVIALGASLTSVQRIVIARRMLREQDEGRAKGVRDPADAVKEAQ